MKFIYFYNYLYESLKTMALMRAIYEYRGSKLTEKEIVQLHHDYNILYEFVNRSYQCIQKEDSIQLEEVRKETFECVKQIAHPFIELPDLKIFI